jgi:hypothetical protein
VPPDGARGAAVTVLDLDAETLKRQASDISIVAHLIAGEPDADPGVAHTEIIQRLLPRPL